MPGYKNVQSIIVIKKSNFFNFHDQHFYVTEFTIVWVTLLVMHILLRNGLNLSSWSNSKDLDCTDLLGWKGCGCPYASKYPTFWIYPTYSLNTINHKWFVLESLCGGAGVVYSQNSQLQKLCNMRGMITCVCWHWRILKKKILDGMEHVYEFTVVGITPAARQVCAAPAW